MYYYMSFKEGRLKSFYVGILFHENPWPVKISNCDLGLLENWEVKMLQYKQADLW
jgi:hypothetical protein